MISFKILRNKKSYDFKAYSERPDSFQNNWKNNSIDYLVLLFENAEVFRCKCQSVANYCFGEMATADTLVYGDTIAQGDFTVQAFVEPRSFHGEIHAITRTRDLDGQWIDHNAMQITKDGYQNGRWLIHDRFSFKTGEDTVSAWSAGCFILGSDDLKALNTMLKSYNVKAGNLIPGTIIEF